MAADQFWTVAQVVSRIRRHIEGDEALQHIWVLGEVSNFKAHASGHWYFTLSDSAQLRAVMFRGDAVRNGFQPDDGLTVIAYGRVGVYERQGQTQLYVQHMEPFGAGQQYAQLEELKRRLQEEGLFSRPKRPLPRLPRAVGVVTSGSGAALSDIRTVAARRFPGLPLQVVAVTVQGDRAPSSIVDGLRRAEAAGVDVVILARGGGAQEDLSAFNSEAVVRAVARSGVPVVSAVGHEVDVTLADLAADLRAPTPSAAAELVVPERSALAAQLEVVRTRLAAQLASRIRHGRDRVGGIRQLGLMAHPERLLAGRRMDVARLEDGMRSGLERTTGVRARQLARLSGRLSGADPTAIMDRGYAWVTGEDGRPAAPETLSAGQRLAVRWRRAGWRVRTEEHLEGMDMLAAGGGEEAGEDGDGRGSPEL